MLDELKPYVDALNANVVRYREFLGTLDEAQLNAPTGDEEGYSPRQVLAHLAGATKSMVVMAQRFQAGLEPKVSPEFDLNFYNKRQQEKRAKMTLDDLMQEWETSHTDLFAFMETLTAEDLKKRGEHPTAGDTDVRGLLDVITTHEAMHMKTVMPSA